MAREEFAESLAGTEHRSTVSAKGRVIFGVYKAPYIGGGLYQVSGILGAFACKLPYQVPR